MLNAAAVSAEKRNPPRSTCSSTVNPEAAAAAGRGRRIKKDNDGLLLDYARCLFWSLLSSIGLLDIINISKRREYKALTYILGFQ